MHYTDNLQSPRLTTRFITKADAAAWVDYCGDPVATQFTGVAGKTPEEMAEFVISLTLKRYEENRLGHQALIRKDTGEFIGQCGLLVQEGVDGITEIEIGYHLLPRHWGNGYATEAAQLFRDYGFHNNFADSIVSIIDPLNEASKKVAIRNGMRLTATNAQFRGNGYNLFRITRDEWAALK